MRGGRTLAQKRVLYCRRAEESEKKATALLPATTTAQLSFGSSVLLSPLSASFPTRSSLSLSLVLAETRRHESREKNKSESHRTHTPASSWTTSTIIAAPAANLLASPCALPRPTPQDTAIFSGRLNCKSRTGGGACACLRRSTAITHRQQRPAFQKKSWTASVCPRRRTTTFACNPPRKQCQTLGTRILVDRAIGRTVGPETFG